MRFLLILTISASLTAAIPRAWAARSAQGSTSGAGAIDPLLWQAAAATPDHKIEFIITMIEPNGEGPQAAIDAQLRLEDTLALLQQAGSLDWFQVILGENIILAKGAAPVLHLLAGWPEVVGLDSNTPGQAWEQRLDALSANTPAAVGSITGTVTSPGGGPLNGIKVTAYRQALPNWPIEGVVYTNASGVYSLANIPTGFYHILFEDPAAGYVPEYFDNKTSFNAANFVTVTDGQTTPNIDAELAQAGKISGLVTQVSNGQPADSISVSAWFYNGSNWTQIANATTAINGVYTIGSLPPGAYRVKFNDLVFPQRFIDEWYNNVTSVNAGTNVNVTANVTTPNINASMGDYGSIKGNVKAYDGVTNLSDIYADIYRFDSTYSVWEWFSYGITDASGNYTATGLGTENFRVEFSDPLNQFASEYYNDKPDVISANDVPVSLGYATANINAQLAIMTDTVTTTLVPGWNLISLPVAQADSTPSSTFANLLGSFGDVFAYAACDASVPYDPWKLYNPGNPSWANDLLSVGTGSGYWINMTAPATLTITGTHPVQTSIPLCTGWNLIGYPSVGVKTVSTALSSISGKYDLVWQYRASDLADPWKSYNPSVPSSLNDLTNMEPGFGYWIKMKQAANLVINGR
jgi:hypothetical protein